MIKCKSGNCPRAGEICCFSCDDREGCAAACPIEAADKCKDAVFEGSTDLEVFQSKSAAAIQAITDIVTAKKDLEEKEKVMKEQLQKTMEKHGIKAFDNDVIKMTYIEASTRNSIDAAKLKKKYPDIAAECVKTSSTKAYVKVEVK